jgi:hypothetical protein
MVLKKGKYFLLILFFVSNLHSYTNKTYIRPIDSSFYFQGQYSFAEFIAKKDDGYNVEASIDFSTFYWESCGSRKIGEYFGVNNTNDIVLANRGNNTDIYHDYLIHQGGDLANQEAHVVLRPKSYYSGCTFSCLYDFSHHIKNLYFKLNIPYVKVENDICLGFSSSGYGVAEDDFMIKKYLMGNFEQTTVDAYMQEALNKAKITDKKIKTGIPFIDFIVGYEFWVEDDYSAVLSLALSAPTISKPNGEYLFEPILTDNDHWGLSVAYESYFTFISKEKSSLNLFFDLRYKYLFENSQTRILSLKGLNWGQYYLLGKSGAQNTGLIPAANLLTRQVDVSPRSQVDANFKLVWNVSDFSLGCGYTFLFRQAEHVSLKDEFLQDTYAVADPTFDTTEQFGQNTEDIDFYDSIYWINNKRIDTQVAETPDLVSHKFYTQFSYNYYDAMQSKVAIFNVGASYNFSSDNSNFDGFSFWVKTELFI